MKKLFFGLCLSLTACSTFTPLGPVALVESPEIAETQKAGPEFYTRLEGTQEFEFANDASARPLTVNNPPKYSTNSDLVVGLRKTIAPRLQISGALPTSFLVTTSAGRTAIKYQFLGHTYEENPNPTVLASIFAHGYYARRENGGNQKGTFGSGGYPWKARGEYMGADLGLSFGYRWSPKGMAFVGGSIQNFGVKGDIEQDLSADGDSPAAKASFDRETGTSSAVAVGTSLGMKSRLDLVYSFSHNRWLDQVQNFHHLSLGFSFLPIEIPPLRVKPIEE